MAQVPQRIFALVGALLFLATSLATGAAVIWQIRKDGQATKPVKSPTLVACSTALPAGKTVKKEGKLEGTALTDFTPCSVSKLESTDIVPGTGEEVKPGATVTAHYTGAVAATGKIFQSSHDQPGDQPIPFSLTGVIKGWTNGVPGMKVGGTRRLLIPAAEAYGGTPPQGSGIPANADLVFDIEATAVQNK